MNGSTTNLTAVFCGRLTVTVLHCVGSPSTSAGAGKLILAPDRRISKHPAHLFAGPRIVNYYLCSRRLPAHSRWRKQLEDSLDSHASVAT